MNPKLAAAAILTIKRPGDMTPRGRQDIAAWLRRQATNFLRRGDKYTSTGNFNARYTYLDEK